MSQALSFAQVELASPQGPRGAPPVSDVLHRAEHLMKPARFVSLQVALAVHRAHFSVGTNDPVFSVRTHSAENRLLRYTKDGLSIFGGGSFRVFLTSLRDLA